MNSLFILFCVWPLAVNGLNVNDHYSSSDGRIVGGNKTSISKYGYQISVQIKFQHLCGGAILDNHWIVTAAHCVFNHTSYQIRSGTSLKDYNGYVHQVVQIEVHPYYNFSAPFDFDVAVMRVKEPFRLNGRTRRKIRLTNVDEDLPTGEIATVTGWGVLNIHGDKSQFLQVVQVPMVDKASCVRAYQKENETLTDNMICAGFPEGGKDSCQGDSGGPLVGENGVMYGIVSWGIDCALPGIPGIYTRVASKEVRNFIRRKTGI